MTTCCVGVPSGYIEPDGTVALMCDDECICWVCVSQQPDALAARAAALAEQGAALDLERTVERISALCDEWWGRATEATSEPLSWRRVCRELRAALDAQ